MGMDQLFCSCNTPAMYKGSSGYVWCEDCSGLVPAEKVLETDRYCKCETVPGKFVKRARAGHIDYGCSKCNKEIHPGREIRSAFEITKDLEEKGHEGVSKLLGPAAFVCDHCNHMEMSPHNEDMTYFISWLKQNRAINCPRCRRTNRLSKGWEVMVR